MLIHLDHFPIENMCIRPLTIKIKESNQELVLQPHDLLNRIDDNLANRFLVLRYKQFQQKMSDEYKKDQQLIMELKLQNLPKIKHSFDAK